MAEQTTKSNEYTLDASGKSLGRVASEAASLLMGKNTASFQRHIAPDVSVTIQNASEVNVSEKKKTQKTYVRYTGYPGGKREESLGHLAGRKGYDEVFRKAVFGMLPGNRLRPIMMKNLHIEE